MELAVVVGDGAAREQQVRLKLHFEDRSILSVEQLQDGLADSWFLVASHLYSISDLASNVIVAFGLVKSCPHGISLRMENFTLPPSQSVRLLKDKDIVSVNKKIISPDAVQQQVKHVHSSSFDTFDKIAPLGVKTHALEEFERETGGYESEQEWEQENDASRARRKDKTPKTSSTKLKQKKRKREKVESTCFRADEQGITKLQVVPYTDGITKEKEKRKKSKKQRLIMQQDDNETRDKVKDKKSNKQVLIIQQDDNKKLCWDGEMQECSKEKNVQEPESSIKIKKKKKEQLMTGDVSLEQPTIQKHHSLKGNSKNVSLFMSSSDKKAVDEERKAGLPVEDESVKKKSRSTLRKKAKRLWRRKHEELTKRLGDKLGDDFRKAAAHKDVGEQPSFNFTTKQEDDGDAEEERLPRVVRPGHIRFEPLDEDDNDDLHSQHSLRRFDWSNGISKRKGQSWGQEKAKRSSKNLEGINDMEICDAQELKLEAFPALKGTPQNGDVIAYRILELTPSFCPELSEYRVGKVVDLESHSGALKLAEVPKYPLRRWVDQNVETNEDLQFSSLYDKDGLFETQMSALAEIRLVEGSSQETCKTAPTKEVLTELELARTGNDTNLNTSTVDTPILTELARTDNDTNLDKSTVDSQMDIDKTCSTNPNASEVHVTTEENSPAPFQGWPELFEVIERKKQELGNKEVILSSGAADLDKPRSENGGSSAGNNSVKDASTGRARGWHKRAGGLGATMALLRSQNVQ